MHGPWEIFPFLLGAIFLVTPIVWILTKHQQKMTAMLNGIDQTRRPLQVPSQNGLEQEVAGLKEVVHQQTLMLDEMRRSQAEIKATLSERQGLTERVNLS